MQTWMQALWPGSFLVENNFHNPSKAESDYMVGGAYGDIADVLLASSANLSAEVLGSYRAVVAVGISETLDAALAAELSASVAYGNLLVIEADEVEAAGAWGWFPTGFFGASLSGAPPTPGQICRVLVHYI